VCIADRVNYLDESKFVVYSCLLVFTILFALRLDGTLEWSYWAVFAPLWFWKLLVIAGAFVGSMVWWQHPQYRVEGEGYVHYKAMLICLALHLLLLMFELLVCDKLESGRHIWVLVFIPLIFISIISIAICVWAVKHDRTFEFELFSSVNVLQFIFLALRLDTFIQWNWVVVFVPLWIVICLALIGVLYAIIFAGILLRAAEVNPEQRRSSVHSAVCYSFLVIPALVFLVLLVNKLDADPGISFIECALPLCISLITLICMSFEAKGGNHWWFGLRKDFCQFLLGACPLLQEYGNISYSLHREDRDEPEDPPVSSKPEKHRIYSHSGRGSLTCSEPKVVVPKLYIDVPD